MQRYETLRQGNPAAGPVFVRGVRPGDELVVAIEKIVLDSQGWTVAWPEDTVLTEGIEGPTTVIVPCLGDTLHLPGGMRLPARPMVGVIGTAPATGEVSTAQPGSQGSNLDIRLITTGARVHLPVHVDGALLALGDVHAAMGDGEVTGGGIEINAEVTVTLNVRPGPGHVRPWIENDEVIASTGSAATLEGAIRIAVDGLVRLIGERAPVSRTEAYALVGAYGDVHIGQACGGIDCTVYATFPCAAFS
jgi:amidase